MSSATLDNIIFLSHRTTAYGMPTVLNIGNIYSLTLMVDAVVVLVH